MCPEKRDTASQKCVPFYNYILNTPVLFLTKQGLGIGYGRARAMLPNPNTVSLRRALDIHFDLCGLVAYKPSDDELLCQTEL